MSTKSATQAIRAWAAGHGYEPGRLAAALSTTLARVAIGGRTVTIVQDGESSGGLRIEVTAAFGRWSRPLVTTPAWHHARKRIAAFAELDALLGEEASWYARGDLLSVYASYDAVERDTAGVVRAIVAIAAALEALGDELDALPRPSYLAWYVAIAAVVIAGWVASYAFIAR